MNNGRFLLNVLIFVCFLFIMTEALKASKKHNVCFLLLRLSFSVEHFKLRE